MDHLFCYLLSFFLSIVETVTSVIGAGQRDGTNAYLASFPIFLLRSMHIVSRIAEVMASVTIVHKKRENRPDAVMQSSIARSSRIDRARGKRIVKPRWYWSVERSIPRQECRVNKSPVLVISAAFTLSMKELPAR